jgi:SagB-type dehydrogenase family enzyme
MTHEASPTTDCADIAVAYHARTKHRPERYAAGPETLDWDAQPNPFREFEGCARIALPLAAARLKTSFADIYAPGSVRPTALSIASIGVLMELSMGLSAWKEYGPDRWALRCNPSSGNLHPTEAYVISSNVPGLEDGLYHYLSREHALEQRCRSTRGLIKPVDAGEATRLWICLSSIHWREAWKYGERGFRYCQLDIGHALGALRYAAGALGWTAKAVENIGCGELAALMGLDRAEEFAGVETEDSDLLIAIDPDPAIQHSGPKNNTPRAWDPKASQWTGRANLLDPHPIYRWPVINQVSLATRGGTVDSEAAAPNYPPLQHEPSKAPAADIILNRRSAQRFDSKFKMGADIFYRMLDCLLVRPIAPWDVWTYTPRLHPIFFIHRVEGLEPGLYALPRHPEAARTLREALSPDFLWQKLDNAPDHLPLVKLMAADCRTVAKTVSCQQAIASDSCFSLGMLGEFEEIVKPNPWRYRQLHWEAGLLGHVLYLEAEAAGLRGTGIGCFFDDLLHNLLGLKTARFQSLYHFTVGYPLTDGRITTLPAYPNGHGRLEEQSP